MPLLLTGRLTRTNGVAAALTFLLCDIASTFPDEVGASIRNWNQNKRLTSGRSNTFGGLSAFGFSPWTASMCNVRTTQQEMEFHQSDVPDCKVLWPLACDVSGPKELCFGT